MADDILKNIPLPADLPENWTSDQIVAPTGAEAGLDEQHGYNYLMRQVNNAQKAAKAIAAALLNYTYPVGRLYMSAEATSPASLFGGTWEQIKDCFILAAGDTYAAGSTGGEAEHTLADSEMPKHKHVTAKGQRHDDETGTKFEQYDTYQAESSITHGYYWTASTLFAGNSQPHNNMPPYVTMYAWKRIA
jgi:hypothetical protein